jgi:hypothetical protein
MPRFLLFTSTGIAVWLSVPSTARAIMIDGVKDAAYGTAVAVQDTPTGFGNNQSELNSAYAYLALNGDLSLLLTGNLENNGNTIALFVDSRAGGSLQSFLPGDFGVLGSIGGQFTDDWGTDIDGSDFITTPFGGGSVLDPGFNPDWALTFSHYFDTYYMNIIDLTIQNDDNQPDKDVYHDYTNIPTGIAASHTYTRADANVSKGHGSLIQHAFLNTNTVGVTDLDAAPALTATTGLEIQLPSSFLANSNQPIRIMAFITNGSGDYLSNQFLGENGLDGAGNLAWSGDVGGDPLFDTRLFPGNQYFKAEPNGDYNADGKVDAADYVLWRKGAGTSAQYAAWRSRFGATMGSGAGLGESASVPEPSVVILLGVALLMMGTKCKSLTRCSSVKSTEIRDGLLAAEMIGVGAELYQQDRRRSGRLKRTTRSQKRDSSATIDNCAGNELRDECHAHGSAWA